MSRRLHLSNMEDFFLSVANGTLKGLETFLQHGGNADLADACGRSLLHKAVEEGNLQKVCLLINSNCNVSIADKEGVTPLHDAIRLHQHEITEALVKHGTNVNIVNSHHTTPLMQAVIEEDLISIDILLSYSETCDINMENYFLQTALTQAVLKENVPICKLLVARGASVKCLYRKGFRLKIAHTMCSNIELMNIFLPLKSLDHHFHLMVACIFQNYSLAETILTLFENPFQLKGLGFITKQEETSTWERLAKTVVKPYKFATICSGNNKLLSMLLNFCGSEHNHVQRKNHSHRATLLVRRLFMHGLIIHPQTSFVSCKYDCQCRLSIFKALRDTDYVPPLKGLCCSVIRQNMSGAVNFDLSVVEKLPIPKPLRDFVCMNNW
ncbi:ankyrin repeat domain-containing protein 7-like [Dreissena polymorpha]|uniref:SOCS box domain-containing protein n=1 Tax=Dreissena polymorpha TaxID=45954 RepID=A0A9D4RD34_DREPO|nr:ankyrin repeat domain-containing protein 7-like [Dreissena polymorpha]XP_052262469.1 ankyrin repeat domain-containing protein 7-like [Dreissena polymorpha]KAH3861945.1 hypothetical protein DPMN_024899 [Dreissena polymorpha]